MLAVTLAILPGCSTTPSGPIIDPGTADAIAPILTSSVAGAVVYAYTRNTNSVNYVSLIRTALNEFLISTNLSGAELQAKLYALNIPELRTGEAQLIMAPLIGAYKAYADKYVKAGIYNDPSLVKLVQALIDGLDQGLLAVQAINTPPGVQPTLPHSTSAGYDELRVVIKAMTRQIENQPLYVARK